MRQERLGTSNTAGAKLDMGSTGTDPAGNLHVSHLNIEKMLEIIKLTGESTKGETWCAFPFTYISE